MPRSKEPTLNEKHHVFGEMEMVVDFSSYVGKGVVLVNESFVDGLVVSDANHLLQ